jgi:heme oxygenase
MAELRAATWPYHQRLERRIEVGARFTNVSRYRAYLERMWGFCAALGCVYVFEGATLGGRSLLPLVASNLNMYAAHGAAFLASYGAHVGSMWRGFRSVMENSCIQPEQRARAVGAAIETFECLDGWLCETPT